MTRYLFLGFTVFFNALSAQEVTQWVDPFIGTDAHGHTFPGATLPFGMVQLSPDTRRSMMDWDGCSGYHYTDSILYGFSHTHLSGTGVPDYADILVMPFTGAVEFNPNEYASTFKKNSETATPGYYSVRLSENNIRCELTATERVGVHRYTFPVTQEVGRILVDLRHRDEVLESGLSYVSNQEITGYRVSKAWAEKQTIYFVMRFSRPFFNSNLMDLSQNPYVSAPEVNSKSVAGVVHFYHDGQPIVVTVGISAVSIEGARRNLEAECPGFDFEAVRFVANKKWETALSRITVVSDDAAQKRTFYTALYHTLLAPNVWSDTDGQYRGMDNQIHRADHPVYTVFSLWDTYRAANPLHALLEPDRMRDFIRTFLLQYEQGGLLPVWELAANETNCMIGNHAIPVILDAYTKGLTDRADTEKLLEAMMKSANLDRLGLKQYKTKGYIPSEEEPESVSKTLEYTFDDWCIAQMATALGKKDVASTFNMRSKYYQNLFDPKSRFFRARANGGWRKPFDPREVNFNFTEANAWQYRFSIQHDIPGMIQLLGGAAPFAAELDALFTQPAATTGRNQADITGLIGQYAHGNEPCHHVAYLYNRVNQPWKTQQKVKQIMRELYTDRPDGLCGNDDCGQMSAWYVWSAMGLYPTTPGMEVYEIGAPLFRQMQVHLPNGNTFAIESDPLQPFIQEAQLNKQSLAESHLRHTDVTKGGKLVFTTGSEPSRWATQTASTTVSTVSQIPVPFVSEGERVFSGKQTIALACADPSAVMYYIFEKDQPKRYSRPFSINTSGQVRFWAERNGQKSYEETASFFKKANDLKVLSYGKPYSPQYTGGGMDGLTDLLSGGADFRSGGWQGFEGVDVEVVLDLGKKQPVSTISANFFQDENSWIFFPVKVVFEISDDGKVFKPVGEVVSQVPITEKGLLQQAYALSLKNTSTRYLRVRGITMGNCPEGHKGAGYASWLFTDEIKVE